MATEAQFVIDIVLCFCEMAESYYFTKKIILLQSLLLYILDYLSQYQSIN